MSSRDIQTDADESMVSFVFIFIIFVIIVFVIHKQKLVKLLYTRVNKQ